MPLTGIDHLLIQTADMEMTRDWYVRVLGMTVGPNPDFKFPVCWLYIGDTDVLHIAEGGANVSDNRKKYLGQQSDATQGTGVIDHIAFHSTGLKDTIDHLTREGIQFNKRQVDDQGLFQLFFLDPNGVKVELNFDNAEAIKIEATVSAADLP